MHNQISDVDFIAFLVILVYVMDKGLGMIFDKLDE